MFPTDPDQVRALIAELQTRLDNAIPFEDRFHVLRLGFPLEDVLAGRADRPVEGDYCLYANARGIRFVALSPEDTQLAVKMKAQGTLTRSEKERALFLLRRLSTIEPLAMDPDPAPIAFEGL